MTIQAGTGKHFVGLRRTPKITEVCIERSGMTRCIVATLAKLRRTVGQELSMVAPMRGVAGFAVFFNRRMLPHERAALFRMAFVAQIVDGAAFDEFIPKAAVMIMAIRAFYFTFFDGVMRLLGNLAANAPMAGKTKFRLRRLQIHLFPRMNRMAVVTGDTGSLMSAHIPMGEGS